MEDEIKSFSYLEKDDKTFEHCKMYFEALQKNINLFSIDMIIQKRELENHIKNFWITPENIQGEATKWLDYNSKRMRSYLNSLKTLATSLHIDSKIYVRTELMREIFNKFVDVWNEDKKKSTDTIRLEL